MQLNEYKTDPYCLQLGQNMATDSFLIYMFLLRYQFLHVFTCCEIVLKIKTKQFCVRDRLKQV